MAKSVATQSGGFVGKGFEGVAEEFERNFATRDELGASFAVCRDGELIVDLWGGVADKVTGRPWQADTLQIVFSGTKGFVATCLMLLFQRGQLDLDSPVARYWPEFAAQGKEHVLVRDLVSHAGRLPALETPVTWRDVLDDRRMASLLAAQAQSSDPRAAGVYHALTFGWLCGELVWRIDGRSVGRFFAEEIAIPLALEIWIGLPEQLEPRVARAQPSATWGTARLGAGGLDDPLQRSIHTNPPRFDRENLPANERDWHAAEVPATNGIGTARSIARLYGSLDRLLSPDSLERAATPLHTFRNPFNGQTQSFSVGYQVQTEVQPLGPVAKAFGHNGSGGSRHGRWPEYGIGFSYTPNMLRDDDRDRRAAALLQALHECLTRPAKR